MKSYSDSELMELYLNDCITTEQYLEFLQIPKIRIEKSTHKRRIFDIKKLNNYQCEKNFRFNHDEIERISVAINMPEQIRTHKGDKFSGIEGLCILLRRLTYTSRYFDMVQMFRRDETALNRIYTYMLNYVCTNYKHLLQSTEHSWQSYHHLHLYSQAITRRGGIMTDVVGLIDGTARRICRPKLNQKLYYSGHKKYHCIKFQGITFPNGLVTHLDGCYPGSRHDSAIYWLSGITKKLEKYMPYNSNKNWFRLYGDQGYSNTKFVVSPYRGNLNDLNRQFNDFMKVPRQSVEWSFGIISKEWDFINCHLQAKLYKSQVEDLYFVATLFSNFRNCLRTNLVSNFFSVLPVQLEDYINQN